MCHAEIERNFMRDIEDCLRRRSLFTTKKLRIKAVSSCVFIVQIFKFGFFSTSEKCFTLFLYFFMIAFHRFFFCFCFGIPNSSMLFCLSSVSLFGFKIFMFFFVQEGTDDPVLSSAMVLARMMESFNNINEGTF